MSETFLEIIIYFNRSINMLLKGLLWIKKRKILKTKKNDLLNTFFFNISFIRVFNFNLNTLTMKLKRLKMYSLDKRFFLISFQLKL